jgi:hypothetical protein
LHIGSREGSKTISNNEFKIITKTKTKKIPKNDLLIYFNLTPSQNFLAENFTLPQGEGDEPVSLTSFFASLVL